MFYYISGELTHKFDNFAVIDVGGVGYKIFTSGNTLSQIKAGHVKLYTYVHVREESFDIFGFASVEELDFFELLISVSGVGPKAALAILSSLTPRELVIAIVTGDAKTISKSQGIGSKISQRIIVELKDKLKDKDTESILSAGVISVSLEPANNEAVEALVSLGYSPQEAARAVAAVQDSGLKTEEVIKQALKTIMR